MGPSSIARDSGEQEGSRCLSRTAASLDHGPNDPRDAKTTFSMKQQATVRHGAPPRPPPQVSPPKINACLWEPVEMTGASDPAVLDVT